MLLNRDGKVFIGQRAPSGDPEAVDARFSWQMPQGGIDKGETPLEAARRELFEETNVRSASLLMEAPEWLYYDLPGDVKKRAWRGRFKGQAQKWFAFRFEGHDDEIDVLHPAGEMKAEFAAWRWESMERLPELIIPFKRDVYEKVILAFGSLAG